MDFCGINAFIMKVLCCISAADSCPVSPKTVKKVESCPETEKEWMENAAKMNCEAHASRCNEPKKLKYHCVINASGGLIEVCAYNQYILNGHCTEYSYSGNLIQGSENIMINSYNFENGTLSYYNSTDAYKFPECYRPIKRTSEIQKPGPNNEQTGPLGDQTTASDILHEKKENKCVINIPNVTVTVLSVVIARKILP